MFARILCAAVIGCKCVQCLYPVKAFAPLGGGPLVFAERGDVRPTVIRCGQCIHCRLERSRAWAVRIMHECQMHLWSSFVTLTYSDENCPRELVYRHFQLFMKRLRKKFPGSRFFMCGEYGDDFGRPHFHACLFGVHFDDRVEFGKSPAGFTIYTSGLLESLWPHGFSSIGDVTFESAAYVARYVCKKVTGPRAESHYECVDGFTGEIFSRVPEFAHMSLKPGIGYNFISKFFDDVYVTDGAIVNGTKFKTPKYYDKYFASISPVEFEFLQFEREHKAALGAEDCTPQRLAVREEVTKARLGFKKRILE